MGSTPPPPPPPGWQSGPQGWQGAPPPPPPAPARRTPWGLIVGIIVVVLLLVGGGITTLLLLNDDDEDTSAEESTTSAATGTSEDPTPTTEAPSTSAAPEVEETQSPAVDVDTSAVVGGWEGAYECGQGDTGLSLEITAGAAEGELTAVFHFRKIPSNPDVPEGSYRMKGFLEEGKLRLRRLEWVDRPEGFVMVGLNARLTERSPQTITGTVSNVGCGDFRIERK